MVSYDRKEIKLAIVIPFFKIDFFEETLLSLAHQTNSNFNLYIGNDGSNTNPLKLLKEYSKILNFNYEVFDHIGYSHLSKHWERCINLTRNEPWIQILGDDDVLDYRFVERFYEIIGNISSDTNIITFNKKIINENGCEFIFFKAFPNNNISSKELFFKRLKGEWSITLSENIFRRTAYEKYGLVDLPVAFGTDIILLLEYSKLKKIYFEKEKLIHVRSSSKNLSNIKDEKIDLGRKRGNFLYRYYLLKSNKNTFSLVEKIIIIKDIKKTILKNFTSLNGFRENLKLLNSLIK